MNKQPLFLIFLPLLCTAGLHPAAAVADTVDDITQSVCLQAHNADAEGLRLLEKNLVQVTMNLHYRYQEAKGKAEDLGKAIDQVRHDILTMKDDLLQLEILLVQAVTVRKDLQSVVEGSFEIIQLNSKLEELRKTEGPDSAVARDLEKKIAELERLSEAQDFYRNLTMDNFWEESARRLSGIYQDDVEFEDIDEALMAAIDTERKLTAEWERVKFNIELAEEKESDLQQDLLDAMGEMIDARGRLEVMQQVLEDTNSCIEDARRTTQPDLTVNFRINCSAPETKYYSCGYGSFWANFDEQGQPNGQAGFGQACVVEEQERQCLVESPARILQVTGGFSTTTLLLTVYYDLPKNETGPRLNHGQFDFSGVLNRSGVSPPWTWRGTGDVQTLENHYRWAPLKNYAITCQGVFDTEEQLKCGE